MENKFTNIKERILYLIEYYKDTKEKFFDKIGMTYGNFKGSAKNRPLNSDAIVNILSIYPQVNPEWLITGKGSMLRNESEPEVFAVCEQKSEYKKPCALCVEKDKRLQALEKIIEMQEKQIVQLQNKKVTQHA